MTHANNLKVSIALSTYNGAKYLCEQLMSFQAQTVLPNELVVCDDGSSDTTLQILEKFKNEAPFEVQIHKNSENLGYAQNFSKALQLCQGDVVFLSDQDDVWDESKIKTMLRVFESHPKTQILIHDLEFCNLNLEPIGQRKIERIESFSDSIKTYKTGMATAIRAPFLKLCLPVPPEVPHDVWIHSCAYRLGLKRVIPEVLALYRRHDMNVTSGGQLNIAKKTKSRDFFFTKLSSPTCAELHIHLNQLKALRGWLSANHYALIDLGMANDSTINLAKTKVDQDISFTEQRIHNLSLGKVARIIPVFRHYLSGGYHDFSGIKSALKDILIN